MELTDSDTGTVSRLKRGSNPQLPRQRALLVGLACLLLAVQALPLFQHRWVEDESWYSMPAVHLLATGEIRNPAMPATDYESHVDTRPPLMPLSLSAAFWLFGFKVAAARAGEALAALLTILVVYAVGRELGDPLAGVIAGFMAASDTFLVLAARTARPEAWVALCGTSALLLILRSHHRQSWSLALAAGMVIGCAALFHVLGLTWFVALSLILLYQERAKIFVSRRTYAYAAGLAVALLPFFLWIFSSPEHIVAAKAMYVRQGLTLTETLAKERLRVVDLLGVPNQRLHLPVPLPLRLHIVLAIAASFLLLWRRNARVFWPLAIIAAIYLLWLFRMPSPSARYYAPMAPIFALAMGFAVTSLAGTRWRRVAIGACVLCVASELVGTALVLYQARQADYPALTVKLREAIPAGHSCYAAMTFQFALHDRGCHSYDRTPFSYTAEVQKPEYMILGDRVMMNGIGTWNDAFGDLRQQAFSFVERKGQLTGRIDDPFYGELRIYRITYDQPPSPGGRP